MVKRAYSARYSLTLSQIKFIASKNVALGRKRIYTRSANRVSTRQVRHGTLASLIRSPSQLVTIALTLVLLILKPIERRFRLDQPVGLKNVYVRVPLGKGLALRF